ncbi:MAG: 1-acyl-sn-glycerol-3-phosphate acyltransferase [Planctomycetes bacterium]|nr:1-acyl-sn-glycerol-3-phosphate acyltransferase [Planctomycetota bacterium]
MSFREYRRRLPSRSAVQVVIWWIGVRTLLRVIFRMLYRLRCLDRNLIPSTGPVIFVSNHQSHLDPLIAGCHLGPFAPLARTTLFDIPFWGWALGQLGGVALAREKSDVGALRAAIKVLKAGGRVLIFPEGTRTRDGEMGPFLPGMLVLVRRTGAAIVPMAVEGARDVWPAGRGRPKLRGRIGVVTGEPISARELLADGREAALDRLRRTIETMRDGLRSRLA